VNRIPRRKSSRSRSSGDECSGAYIDASMRMEVFRHALFSSAHAHEQMLIKQRLYAANIPP
jgi:hypothetical protein